MTDPQTVPADSTTPEGLILPAGHSTADTADNAGTADKAAAATEAPEAPQNPLLHHLDLQFPAEQIDKKIDAALQAQQKNVSMAGFRRGKVPLSVLRQRYGKDTLHEVLRHECAPKFQEALEEKNQRAAAAPRLHLPDVAAAEGYKVHCDYEIIPDIAAPDFADKVIKKPTFAVDDAAVDEMIDVLRRQRGNYVPAAEDTVGEDHRVLADFKSILLPKPDSEEKEEKVIESGSNHPFVLSEKRMFAPQLREKLLGARAGETVSADMPVPEDAPNAEIRGHTVRMQLTVNTVEKLEKAELNDEFFAYFGVEEKTIDAFRTLVREHLQRESKIRLRNFLHSRAMNLLMMSTAAFPLPQSMVFGETYRQMQQAQAQWKERGMAESAASVSPQMFLPDAQRRVALGLILSAWQQREKVSIEKDELETRLLEICEAYENPAEAAAKIRGDKNEMEAVYLSVLEDRVTDWVCEQCKNEEEAMSLQDFLSEGGDGAGAAAA